MTTKYACVCGWQSKGSEAVYVRDGRKLCPRCYRGGKNRLPAIRDVFPIIPCHWCKSPKQVSLTGSREYYCHRCNKHFDDDPNEGGDALSHDPVRSLEKKERAEAKR